MKKLVNKVRSKRITALIKNDVRSQKEQIETSLQSTVIQASPLDQLRLTSTSSGSNAEVKESSPTVHLNKYISTAGVCSRRKAVQLIKAGSVTVNKKLVKLPYYQVKKTDRVEVNGSSVNPVARKKIYIIMNKPAECVTSVADDKGRRTVIDLLGTEVKERVYPVGRLDWETTGALLLTNDGDLTQKLGHPSHEIDKEYHVTLNKPLTWEHMHEIKKGVRLSDGLVKIDDISFFPTKRKNCVRVTLHSGKYRVIRRLFKTLGYEVDLLDRARFAHLNTRRLRKGGWRFLTEREVARLKQ
jgi:23S rRNA pseudouridine2605 synthase